MILRDSSNHPKEEKVIDMVCIFVASPLRVLHVIVQSISMQKIMLTYDATACHLFYHCFFFSNVFANSSHQKIHFDTHFKCFVVLFDFVNSCDLPAGVHFLGFRILNP